MSQATTGPTLRDRVLAVVVGGFGLLAVVAALRAGSGGYAGVGAFWLTSAAVLWRLAGAWLLLGLALFAAGFVVLAAIG